ncbi:replicative DNA helicase [Azorhizobium caulinodans]|uniref:replicative DNA helicase n=1 Tax=Azorhizobium caulinodans TaxID=7 RepID=UPI002FBD3275
MTTNALRAPIEAEQALLGAILINNEAYGPVSSIIRPDHFSDPVHRKLFELFQDSISQGRAATPLTLKDRLPADLNVGGLSGMQYMARLASEACTVINAPDYAQVVRDSWASREVCKVSEEAASFLASPSADPKHAISVLLSELDIIRAELDHQKQSRQPIGACASGVLERIDAIQAGTMPIGASTGLTDLDRSIGGLQPGRLVVVAGRPGMGKTIVGANIARAVAANGDGCALFSLEMPSEEIGSRILSDQAFHPNFVVSSKQIYEGRLNGQEMQRVERAAAELASIPLIIDASPSLTVSEISARCRTGADELRRRGVELRVIVIDYLKFVKSSERYRGQRVYEVGEITAGLKALAKDMGICVVLLAQLNRAVEQRADRRPELSDLRESGDIEADADIVLLLFREAYYLKDKSDPESQAKLAAVEDQIDIIVAKCRMGSPGTVTAYCNPAASVIRDWR